MKLQILLLALTVALLSSCTTAYKTGQTPDDVYFSPAQPEDEYVRVEKRDDRRYQSRDEYYDDRYLRMRVHNRMQWSALDDWYYYGNRYDYSYYNSFYWNNPWSPCSYWNNHYNPYYSSYVIIKPQSSVFNRPRTFNLNTYNNNLLTNNNYTNPKGIRTSGVRNTSGYTNSNSGGYSNGRSSGGNSNSGSFLRNVFNNNNSSSGSSNNNSSSGSSKTSSSSSSSGSSSGSSGGSAPARRF